IADAAKQRWIDSGISAEQLAALNSVTYQISDLGPNHLGNTEGTTITIDDDAAGSGGWFIDATPLLDEEFISLSDNRFTAISGGEASGHYDLLTILIHEQGHILGLDHDGSGGVMSSSLSGGQRRLPSAAEALGADPLSSTESENALTTASIVGSTLSIIGDGASDSLILRVNAGNFEYDLNSGGFVIIGAVAGVDTITIDMGTGTDSVTIQPMTVAADFSVRSADFTIDAGGLDISGAATPEASINAD
ncbi:MAG: hypothetical protein KDM63_21920, partial [Verrucomicrobiae bacterium]|nr:hypothetical protein [Verrucomicrobiae bacterium]